MGLGGAGCKVVERMSGMAGDGVSVVAVNTDARALEESSAAVKMQLAPSVTKGLGTGGDVGMGKKALEADIVKISAMCMDASLVVLVVGLGGGTGTGGASVVLNAAREAGAMTLCFATLPFSFEGSQRRAHAERAIPELNKLADALIMVRNDRLSEFVGKSGVSESFDLANEVLTNGVSSIAKLLIRPGFINLDFSDLRKVVESGGGICTFGYGYGEGPSKGMQAVKELLSSPLVSGGDVIDDARSMLISIIGGDDLALKDIGDVMDAVSGRVRPGCNVSMGTVIDSEWSGRIGVTMVTSEKWIDPDDVYDETEGVEDHERIDITGGDPAQESTRGEKRKRKAQLMQEKLSLKSVSMDRFKGAAPSIMNGEDLDIPTYLRRGIKLDK